MHGNRRISPTSIGLRKDGGAVVRLLRDIHLWDFDSRWIPLVTPEPGMPLNRLNEGAVAPDGSFWVATMRNNFLPDGRPIATNERTGATASATALTEQGPPLDLVATLGFSDWRGAVAAPTIPRMARNVLGGDLEPCCYQPMTGFYRDGFCHTGPGDFGVHTVCAVMTEEFLKFSFEQGNDLTTPRPDFEFPGLKPGDRWCLCASRWKEAYDAGMAPKIVLEATHASTLEFANIEELQACAAG